MASTSKDVGPKKRRITEELRSFQDKWTINYFFVEIKTKPICLKCNESVSVLKEYNIKRHYEIKHANKFDKYKGQFRQDQVNDLKNFLHNKRYLLQSIRGDETVNVNKPSPVSPQLTARSGQSA
jgi:hypothetical protein